VIHTAGRYSLLPELPGSIHGAGGIGGIGQPHFSVFGNHLQPVTFCNRFTAFLSFSWMG
jgi:hypothetical protein